MNMSRTVSLLVEFAQEVITNETGQISVSFLVPKVWLTVRLLIVGSSVIVMCGFALMLLLE
jgi:hypothetical protein